MSFLKRLFGGGGASREAGSQSDPVEYRGYSIVATPFAAEGQFQTCGVISKEVDGVVKEHRFVRADRFASANEAASFAERKAQQIIDEQGDRIFG